LMFAPESPHFRPLTAGYYAALLEIPVQIWPLAVRQFDYYLTAFDFDYIVLRTKNSMFAVLGKTRPQMERAEDVLLSELPFFNKFFNRLFEVELFDGSKAVILKKIKEMPYANDEKLYENLLLEGTKENEESPFLHYEYRKQGRNVNLQIIG